MLHEIMEIPRQAEEFWSATSPIDLPLQVPYLGMGSSYFAPLAFKYMGIPIHPEIASEFYNYQAKSKCFSQGVIISQSGRSSEALWCTKLFDSYIGISNHTESSLCTTSNMSRCIDLLAGNEQFSASKTYINTLLALYKCFGFEVTDSLALLKKRMPDYARKGEEMAHKIYDRIIEKTIHAIYILGSGPNLATALEAALILTESTRLNFHGMAMAQYDQGPKEAAEASMVIQILAKGVSWDRSVRLTEIISRAGATVISVEEPDVDENFSILHNILPFNFMAYFLAQKLNAQKPFIIGSKITETN
jgi:glucosamine--fructose-6-phosphate aminotransferase (isomerizing)